ncbi:MAG: hypothetical protein OSJ42_06840, partial [Bacteroidales bacterium]|nr:hypothetical protein [Bacteroidales bacterium]
NIAKVESRGKINFPSAETKRIYERQLKYNDSFDIYRPLTPGHRALFQYWVTLISPALLASDFPIKQIEAVLVFPDVFSVTSIRIELPLLVTVIQLPTYLRLDLSEGMT